MPEVKLEIGGRSFPVVCQPGEEENLEKAAALLADEAETLQGQLGRLPENRMLLMAGLMLADKNQEMLSAVSGAEERIHQLQTQLKTVEEKAAQIAASAVQVNDQDQSAALAASEKEGAAARHLLTQVAEHLEDLATALEAR
ncbi:MAG: cell division protein ZapA [Pseudomonadota bacterium]